MCWGVPGVLISVDSERGTAKVDFGDGLPREVLVGIKEERLERGAIVMVHAGVIISVIDEKGLMDTYELLSELLRQFGEAEDDKMKEYYGYLVELSRSLRGGQTP